MEGSRASYDARWAALDAAGSPTAPLSCSDIPWPLEPPPPAGPQPRTAGPSRPPPSAPPPAPSASTLRDFLLLGASGPADVKRRLRVELLRWHPDKFAARFGARLAAGGPGQQEAALARAGQLAQVLTQVLAG